MQVVKSAAGIQKLYYSIGEIAEMVGEETHVLRFWETEFAQLRPRRDRAGRRIYTLEDLAVVQRIWHLVKVDKYTLEGAKQVLARAGEGHDRAALHKELRRLRAFLQNIERQLGVNSRSGT